MYAEKGKDKEGRDFTQRSKGCFSKKIIPKFLFDKLIKYERVLCARQVYFFIF